MDNRSYANTDRFDSFKRFLKTILPSRYTYLLYFSLDFWTRWRPAASWIWSKGKYGRSIHRLRTFYLKTKNEVDRMTHCRDMAFRNFPRWLPAAILDFRKVKVLANQLEGTYADTQSKHASRLGESTVLAGIADQTSL